MISNIARKEHTKNHKENYKKSKIKNNAGKVIIYCIVNNVLLTTQKHVGHGCQIQGDFTSDIAVFASDFVQCPALISSPCVLHNGCVLHDCSLFS